MRQKQFLEVVDRDEAERRWRSVVRAGPLGRESAALEDLIGRVLAEDVRSEVDVPGFDRSNMDGFAVRAADTFGASEARPVRLSLNSETIATGVEPSLEVAEGTATQIATGGMLPRGADAVVPVELTDVDEDTGTLVVRAPRVPGAALSYAGTDVGRGETVLFEGTPMTSRETGVLAAIGRTRVLVYCRPRVAILSTGDEIVQPGEAMRPGLVYDSNGRILADAVRELGALPRLMGVIPDEVEAVAKALREAIAEADVVLLSGGTSKGEGDVNAVAVADLDPGIVVHGVALKPGKPICLAAAGEVPVVILPGFPTSAIFTFHEFVAPVLRSLGGRGSLQRDTVKATLCVDTVSERGRLEYLLVGLVGRADGQFAAYPMGKGSGSVTAFSRADGFVRIGRNTERVDADREVDVTLIGRELPVADLVAIGSHCAGLDVIAGALSSEGFRVKVLAVGSQGGLDAARRGECDVAPIHLLDADSGVYNEPFLVEELTLVRGYRRMQGVVSRADEVRDIEELIDDPKLRMVNRNRGAGTRILIDGLLRGRRPTGYAYEPRSHYAVAAAVVQGRADWGMTIETIARQSGLHFRPVQEEHYDFAVPRDRWDRPAMVALRRILEPGGAIRRELASLGFNAD